MLDSGANVSLLSTKFYPYIKKCKFERVNMSVLVANNSVMSISKRYFVPIRLENNQIMHCWFLLADISQECILGMDLMHSISIDKHKSTACVNGHNLTLIRPPETFKIFATQDTEIEPFSSNFVFIKPLRSCSEFILDAPSEGFICEESLDVVEGLYSATQEHVIICNNSPFKISIPKGTCLGEGSSLEERNGRKETNALILVENDSEHLKEYKIAVENRRRKYDPENSNSYLEIQIG